MTSCYLLKDIAQILKAEIKGNPETEIKSIASLDKANSAQLSFYYDKRYKSSLLATNAAAVLLTSDDLADCPTAAIICEHPYYAYTHIAHLFADQPQFKPGIASTAIVAATAKIGKNVIILANVVIGEAVEIGDNTIIYPGTFIGDKVKIGKNSIIYSNVSIYHHSDIGERAIIHSGVVIGSDGFGFLQRKDGWHKVPQIGGVRIGDDVEIGANTTIDRGAVDDTIIGNGVKLDNQIQIAHNVEIGDHTVIAAQTAIAGSAKIGKHCQFGGKVAVNGHIKIADHVMLTAMTGVSNSILKPGVYSGGIPPQPHENWLRSAVVFKNLAQLMKRISKLEKEKNG